MSTDYISHLKNANEIEPDKHDGSYQLVRETVKALERVNANLLDYKDMNLLYFMTIGTFTKVSNYQNKKRHIAESNLADDDKEKLKSLLDQLKADAEKGKFENQGWFGELEGKGSIGMFGSGFGSFSKFKAESQGYRDFIIACTKILNEDDEERIFEITEEALSEKIPGLGIASVSQILHCLKPFVFPILNQGTNAGLYAFKKLGIKLKEPSNPKKYIENVRAIKQFRDQHFEFKNYRVIDLAFTNLNENEQLTKPFSDLFQNREEANWAFDFMGSIAERLDISNADDPRLAMSLRHGGKTLNFIYCNWLVVRFQIKNNERKILITLIKKESDPYASFHREDFTLPFDNQRAALYLFPVEKIKDIDEDLANLIEETLSHLKTRFENHSRSPFRSRPSHVQEILRMIFDDDLRYKVLQEGLSDESREKIEPNIWWVNQKELVGNSLWAPLKNRAGKNVYHWDTMAEANKGDIVLHYYNGSLHYVSQITKPAQITTNPNHSDDSKDQPGRRLEMEHDELDPPIPLTAFNNKVLELNIEQGPLDKTGGIKEGYFFRFSAEALKIIQESKPDTKWPDYALYTNFIEPINPVYTIEEISKDLNIPNNELSRLVSSIERKGQAIIYGPPGTGKTFMAEKIAKHLIGGGDGFYEIVQFHPAYTYEDFMQGLRPVTTDTDKLEYKLVPGRFMNFCEKSRNSDDICVMIIDEINRANLARVFGELMYLLEYRDKEIPLASGKTMQIPNNIRIIGTMNTADRSIALVDYALRRRFAFYSIRPNYEALAAFHGNSNFDTDKLISVLKQLNQEIGDPHYEIGHSFFMLPNITNQLEDIWQMEIIPYLEEYFFDQPDKIQNFTWNKIKERVIL